MKPTARAATILGLALLGWAQAARAQLPPPGAEPAGPAVPASTQPTTEPGLPHIRIDVPNRTVEWTPTSCCPRARWNCW